MDVFIALFTVCALFVAELLVVVLDVIVGGISAVVGRGFRKVFHKGLWFLVLPPIAFAYGIFVERNIYHVKTVEIESGSVPESFDGYRIVQLSDIHLGSFKYRHKSLARAVSKVNSLEPDAILFSGDLITFDPSELDATENILAGLKAADGVYSVLGNHDYCMYSDADSQGEVLSKIEELVSRQKAIGWNLLMDESVNIVRGNVSPQDTISIIGVQNTSAIPGFPSYGDIESAKRGANGRFNVLLSHDPTHWRKEITKDNDINLMLSGHTHAMQLAFFGWSPSSLVFKEYSGLYERSTGKVKGNRTDRVKTDNPQYLYVNTGLGETGFPARLGVYPEITLIVLKSSCRDRL